MIEASKSLSIDYKIQSLLRLVVACEGMSKIFIGGCQISASREHALRNVPRIVRPVISKILLCTFHSHLQASIKFG